MVNAHWRVPTPLPAPSNASFSSSLFAAAAAPFSATPLLLQLVDAHGPELSVALLDEMHYTEAVIMHI
jgi:hypothetical protein